MALGEPSPGFIRQQFAMKKGGGAQVQRPVKQPLPRRAYEQIRSPHDLGNAHRRIIRDAGQLIRRDIVRPPDHKIAKIPAGHEPLRTEPLIQKFNPLPVRHPEAPGKWRPPARRPGSLATCARIDRLIIAMGCRYGGLYVFARAGAGVNPITGTQFFQNGAIALHSRTLVVRAKRAATIRTFAPLQAEPTQILNHRRHILRPAAAPIQILVPQNQGPAALPASFLGGPERPRMTEVHKAGRRRCQPPAIARRGRRTGG